MIKLSSLKMWKMKDLLRSLTFIKNIKCIYDVDHVERNFKILRGVIPESRKVSISVLFSEEVIVTDKELMHISKAIVRGEHKQKIFNAILPLVEENKKKIVMIAIDNIYYDMKSNNDLDMSETIGNLEKFK